MNKRFWLIFVVILINAFLIEAKTIEVGLLVNGLAPVQDYSSIVFTDYSVSFDDIVVLEYGAIDVEYNGSFRAELISSKKKILYKTDFEPSFLILSDPPISLNKTYVRLNFPYSSDVKYLKVFWNNEEKLNLDISKIICNKNKKCDGYENFLGCSDCKLYDNDSLCNSIIGDYYCDYDCYNDTDCWQANCNDGKKNGNELGIDCGGNCPACKKTTGKAVLEFVAEKIKVAGNAIKELFS